LIDGRLKMDFKTHLEKAWRLTLKYIAPLIIMTLVMIAACFFTLGILGPVTLAGYMNSILLMIREGREPKVQDVFAHMKLFFPLLLFGIVVFLAVLIGFSIFVIPGIAVVIAVAYCCLYMLPLITDKKLGIVDAVKESFSMTTNGSWIDNIAVFIIFIGVIALGSTTFIGALFTHPFATIFLISVYDEKKGKGEEIVESEEDIG
jgi:hypothetical protein